MASAAEAEIISLYMNEQEQILLQNKTCEEWGHKQPPTSMKTDNNTVCGIINGRFKQNRSKLIKM